MTPPGISPDVTIAEAVRRVHAALLAADVEESRLEARLLVASAISGDLTALVLREKQPLGAAAARLVALLARRVAREPISRILGRRAFYGLDFHLNAATLDPRPDTETLVEAVLAHVDAGVGRGAPWRLLDIGAGTGAILLALLANLPAAQGVTRLVQTPVEDLRIDFEDGLGPRTSSEEDALATRAGSELAHALREGTAARRMGLRIRPLDEGTGARGLRTLTLFLTALAETLDGASFTCELVLTVPKVQHEESVRIACAALDALEEIGLSQAPKSGIEILTAAGAVQGDDGRMRFLRALVEDMLAVAARDITLFARDPKHDLHLTGSNVHYGTAGAAVHIVDPINLTYRDSTAQDLYDAARLVDNLDNIHFYQRTMVCRDVLDNFDMDVNTLYACLAGTTKHVGTSFSDPSHVAGCFDLLHMVAGGEEAWRERPFGTELPPKAELEQRLHAALVEARERLARRVVLLEGNSDE